MDKVIPMNNFKTSAKRLGQFVGHVCLVEYYHHDASSEPTLSALSKVVDMFYGVIDAEPYIALRFSEGTDITFTGASYNTNLSNNNIVFSSKFDNKTHCIITKQNRKE